jgi:DNA-binding NarL/FixJ family response regulator
MTLLPSKNRITLRLPFLSTIRVPGELFYTWNFHPDLIHSALQQGAHGYLSTTSPARELVSALEAVHAGETIIS